MSPFDKDFGRWCFDNGVRVVWVIPMDAAHDGISCSDILEQFVSELDPDDAKEIFGKEFSKFYAEDGVEGEEGFLSAVDATQSYGFLMLAEIQIKERIAGHKSAYTAGWGRTNPQHFYAATLEELGEKCQAWAVERLASFKKRKPIKQTFSFGETDKD